MASSDLETLSAARNSKWDGNASGKVLPLPQKVSSKPLSGKMDTYTQKDNHAERNNNEQTKAKPTHKIHRENSMPSGNVTVTDLSSSFVNAMFKYNGLNLSPNFTDPSSAAITNAAYLSAFGLPFPPLPMQFNPGNIAVASVMPNALETLAAQLGTIGHPHMPPSPCTSSGDFNPANVFSNSARPRISSLVNDYDQLSNYLRYYTNSLNPLMAGQDSATFSLPSTRKHPTAKSDKSRKESAMETSRSSAVSTHDKTSGFQNGGESKRSTVAQSAVKHKLDPTIHSDTRKVNKLPTLPIKEQKSRPAERIKPAENLVKPQSKITEKHHANKSSGKQKNTHVLKPNNKDFGAEEAAAILLHLSSAADGECNEATAGQNQAKLGVLQQPIDYSSRPVAQSTKRKVWSESTFRTANKPDNKLTIEKQHSNKQSVDVVSPGSEISDTEYTFELNSDGSKAQPGGFNFKKVICKKFTSERDPTDKTATTDVEKPTSAPHVSNYSNIQYGNNSIKLDKNTHQPPFSGGNKGVKTAKPLQGKVKTSTNYNHKNSSKKYIKPANNKAKPHYSPQSFSDLRAISKQFHPNTAVKSAQRSGAKGLYRDAFGGSCSSLESEGEKSDNEDKEEDSESETESSSEESDDEEMEESDVSDHENSPKPPPVEEKSDKSPIKRQFLLSRPKFTLSKATFQSKEQEASPPQQDGSNDQSRITIRSPTFKFSKLSNESKSKGTEPRDSHPNKSGLKHRMKTPMPRVSAITLPKPRLAARVSKTVDKTKKFNALPELTFDDGSKSTLKSLFMQALNKSGESGGKPVGIPVDHKSLKAIGLGTTSYFLHNNKKYILRRALAKKKVVSAKQSGKEATGKDDLRKKSEYVIQQVVQSTKSIRNDRSSGKNDNDVNKAEPVKRDDANNDQSKESSKSSSATKRRKRSLDFIPTITCDDDCDIFSKVKLRRHRMSLHNLTKDNSTTSKVKQSNIAISHSVNRHSRKRHKHAKRSLKSSADLFLLNQLNYNKSVSRAKNILRRNENLRKSIPNIRKSDFLKRPSHSVRIMASGATRPSYQILRQLRESKDENNNSTVSEKPENDDSKNIDKTDDKMVTEIIPESIPDAKNSDSITEKSADSQVEMPACKPTDEEISEGKNECLQTNEISETIYDNSDDVTSSAKQNSASIVEGSKVNKLKRKSTVANGLKPKINPNESFKLSSLFTGPPTLSLDATFCDVQPSYTMWLTANELHKQSIHKQVLLGWKFGENAVEIKQQQQRDEWKNMTFNTFPNA